MNRISYSLSKDEVLLGVSVSKCTGVSLYLCVCVHKRENYKCGIEIICLKFRERFILTRIDRMRLFLEKILRNCALGQKEALECFQHANPGLDVCVWLNEKKKKKLHQARYSFGMPK